MGDGAKLRSSLEWLARLQFNFAGFFLIIGVMTRTASTCSLSIVAFNNAALDSLLVGSLTLGLPMRRRLARFYSLNLAIPALAILWCAFEQVRAPLTTPLTTQWSAIVSTAVCALGVNVADALTIARFRPEGAPLSGAILPILRATVPYCLAVLLAGAITAITQSIWPDILAGFVVVYLHLLAPHFYRRINKFDVADCAADDMNAYQLALDEPRLGILLTPAWKENIGVARKRIALERNR